MSFLNKLASIAKKAVEVTSYIDSEFSISNRVIQNFAAKGTNPKLSKPTREIMETLDSFGITYEVEKTFSNCRNERMLPFDFCIHTKKGMFLIEYDGIQHYKPCFGLTEDQKLENFNHTKTNDEIKNNFCKENNIPLYRIAYNENHVLKTMNILRKHNLI